MSEMTQTAASSNQNRFTLAGFWRGHGSWYHGSAGLLWEACCINYTSTAAITMSCKPRPSVVHKMVMHTVWSPEGWIIFSPGHGGLALECVRERKPVVFLFKNAFQKAAVQDHLVAMISKGIKDSNDGRFFKQWALGNDNPSTGSPVEPHVEAPAPKALPAPPAQEAAAPKSAAAKSNAGNDSESEAAGSSSSSEDIWFNGPRMILPGNAKITIITRNYP